MFKSFMVISFSEALQTSAVLRNGPRLLHCLWGFICGFFFLLEFYSLPSSCFQTTFSRAGNILGFCNLLVVQLRHTQNSSELKFISPSACFLLAVTSACFSFSNYSILQLSHLCLFVFLFKHFHAHFYIPESS